MANYVRGMCRTCKEREREVPRSRDCDCGQSAWSVVASVIEFWIWKWDKVRAGQVREKLITESSISPPHIHTGMCVKVVHYVQACVDM